GQPHAVLLGLVQSFRRAGDGGAADVDDAVQVEECDVVRLMQVCHPASLSRVYPADRLRACRVARTWRSASVYGLRSGRIAAASARYSAALSWSPVRDRARPSPKFA